MVGFPHSEIIGSKLIRSSPTLIAAYYVLHRLCTPRHPLNALKTLDRSHYQCPQHQRRQPLLKANVSVVGIVKCQRHHDAGCLIGQIKLTRIHVASLFLPRGAGSNETKSHLFTMSKDPDRGHRSVQQIQTCSLDLTRMYRLGAGNHQLNQVKEMVEPDGIEPTTSCLQSRRSPS